MTASVSAASGQLGLDFIQALTRDILSFQEQLQDSQTNHRHLRASLEDEVAASRRRGAALESEHADIRARLVALEANATVNVASVVREVKLPEPTPPSVQIEEVAPAPPRSKTPPPRPPTLDISDGPPPAAPLPTPLPASDSRAPLSAPLPARSHHPRPWELPVADAAPPPAKRAGHPQRPVAEADPWAGGFDPWSREAGKSSCRDPPAAQQQATSSRSAPCPIGQTAMPTRDVPMADAALQAPMPTLTPTLAPPPVPASVPAPVSSPMPAPVPSLVASQVPAPVPAAVPAPVPTPLPALPVKAPPPSFASAVGAPAVPMPQPAPLPFSETSRAAPVKAMPSQWQNPIGAGTTHPTSGACGIQQLLVKPPPPFVDVSVASPAGGGNGAAGVLTPGQPALQGVKAPPPSATNAGQLMRKAPPAQFRQSDL